MNIAGAVCLRPGHRPRRGGEPKTFAEEINPQEGIWSLLKRALADFAAADLTHLTRVIKRNLKKIQCRPHLIVIAERYFTARELVRTLCAAVARFCAAVSACSGAGRDAQAMQGRRKNDARRVPDLR